MYVVNLNYTNIVNMLFDSIKNNIFSKLLMMYTMTTLIIVANSPTNAFDKHQLNGKHLHVIWVG